MISGILKNRRSFRRGVTLAEVTMAMAISTIVSIAIMSLFLMVSHLHKSIFSQQVALQDAKRAIEMMNREVRLAEAPLRLVDDLDGDNWSNAIEFTRPGESTVRRIELNPGEDGDQSTPWDNVLVFYADKDLTTGTLLLAEHLAYTDAKGAFHYNGAHTPLEVNLRVGDTIYDADMANTGKQFQGAEIHITISPRNYMP
jgi:type II secretory pathway pseudopilin PulG